MATFSTTRGKTIEELKAIREQKAAEMRANKQLMEAQRLLEEQEAKAQEEMAKKEAEEEEREKREKAMEALVQKRNMDIAAKALLEAKANLPKTIRESLIKHTLCNIMLESLWVDDSVKSSPEFLPQTINLFEEVIHNCDETTGTKLTSNMKNTRLLEYIDSVVTEAANDICSRILTEAEETKSMTINFKPKEEELSELDQKIRDADTKNISKMVKKKVLEVIKEEKESGKVKAEIFKELDEANQDEEESGEDDVEESLVGLPMDATMESIEFHDESVSSTRHLLNKTGTLLTLADKEAVKKNTEKSIACYEQVSDYLGQIATMLPYQSVEEATEIVDALTESYNSRLFNIKIGTGKAERVKEVTQIPYGTVVTKTIPMISKYCSDMQKALRNNNILTETVDQIKTRLIREKASRQVTSNIGSSLFESRLIKNTRAVQDTVLESGQNILQPDVQNAALLQTIVEYTMLETLNTLQVYHFDSSVVAKLKTM